MRCTQPYNESGFTLTELLIAMAISGLLLAAVVTTFLIQRSSFALQEQITEMVQNARAAMDMMTREIRMAGYDPTRTAGASIVSAQANTINFTLDTTNTAGGGGPDGNVNGPNENITYTLYTTNGVQKLSRKTGGTNGQNQPLIEHVQALNFVYRDGAGNVTTSPATIRQVLITVTTRTAKPDPKYPFNGGYRTYTLRAVATPRNLAY